MEPLDLAAFDYPSIRAVFHGVLAACVKRLTKKELELAFGILELGEFEELDDVELEMLQDTALFSRRGMQGFRLDNDRAVDRIASKFSLGKDRLAAHLAARLPLASISIYETVESLHDGIVVVKDILDAGRIRQIRDDAFAASAKAGVYFGARFLDTGPWLIGFGTVVALRKSEAVAIALSLALADENGEARDSLHELLYQCELHDHNVTLNAVAPLIMAVAHSIDESDSSALDYVARLAQAGSLDGMAGD